MLNMPLLTTARLLIRPFIMDDFDDVHRLLDIELEASALHIDKMHSMAERAQWLQWSVLSHVQLAKLNQPPYGDRAVQHRATGDLIGVCGFVPCLAPFELIPYFSSGGNGHSHVPGTGLKSASTEPAPQRQASQPFPSRRTRKVPIAADVRYTPEVGLFYAIAPSHQGQGYASEVARALAEYAFQHLHLKRVVATTDYDNHASIGVMRKIGMHIEFNACPEPTWLQVVGVLENPAP